MMYFSGREDRTASGVFRPPQTLEKQGSGLAMQHFFNMVCKCMNTRPDPTLLKWERLTVVSLYCIISTIAENIYKLKHDERKRERVLIFEIFCPSIENPRFS